MMKYKQSQAGFLIVAAIVLIAIFAVIGVMATYFVNNDMLSTTNHLGSEQAFYIAESGLEGGAHQLSISNIANRTTCATVAGNANLTNFTFDNAKGPFTVTGTIQSPTASTLSGAISASTTTIALNNAATYAARGRIMIDQELINYITISGNNFINVQRGVAGTTAIAHASGAPVGQYQCLLQSQGGVPTLSPAGNTIGGKRWLNETVQLPMTIAVGNNNGQAMSIIHWNKPVELAWNDFSVSGNTKDLNSIFALSYADAWAVGQTGTFLHWNGNNWTAIASGDNSNYNGVYCIASNNCWAVGNQRSFDFWNGSNWTVQTTTVSSIPNVAYNSVYCIATNDCWAVGNTASGDDLMVHWDGAAWSRDTSNPTPSVNLNSVWCVASSSCWAVGVSRTFLLWTGSVWVDYSVTKLPDVTYTGITCVNKNDCWAVGNRTGGNSVLVHWNGLSWSQDTSSGTNQNLSGVSCYSTNSCWAVGNNATTLYWDGSNWTTVSNTLGSINVNSVSALGVATQPASAWQEIFP